jgi:hypothetical protein
MTASWVDWTIPAPSSSMSSGFEFSLLGRLTWRHLELTGQFQLRAHRWALGLKLLCLANWHDDTFSWLDISSSELIDELWVWILFAWQADMTTPSVDKAITSSHPISLRFNLLGVSWILLIKGCMLNDKCVVCYAGHKTMYV